MSDRPRTLAALREAFEAVEALRSVLWQALLDELGRSGSPFGDDADTRLLADAGTRLADVNAAVLALALDAERDAAVDRDPTPAQPIAPSAEQAWAPAEPAPAVAPDAEAVIVDERESAPRLAPKPTFASEQSPAPGAFAPGARARVSGESATSSPHRPRGREGEIEIRDERGDEGPAAWIRSIGLQLERFEHDRQPFAVLLVELVELERLRRERPQAVASLAGQLERVLAAELAEAHGSLTGERPGRCWLLFAGTDHAHAAVLAQHVTRAVATGAWHGGESPAVAVGIAVCPEDGHEAAALAAHADVGLYAARARVRAQASPRAMPVDESARQIP